MRETLLPEFQGRKWLPRLCSLRVRGYTEGMTQTKSLEARIEAKVVVGMSRGRAIQEANRERADEATNDWNASA